MQSMYFRWLPNGWFFTSNRVIIHGITFARNRFKFALFSDSTDNSTVAYNLLKTGLSESKYEEED